MKFLDVLKEQIIILDGGMGTMVQALELTDADFGGPQFKMLSDILALSRSQDLKAIHTKYLEAGANAIETNTFGASRLRLEEYDLTQIETSSFDNLPEGKDITALSYDEFAYELNKASAQIACQALEEYQSLEEGKRPLFVLGCIGPSNVMLSSTQADLRQGTYEQITDNFYHQCLGLIDGGVQVLCYDTAQDQLELKAAVHAGQKAMKERGVTLPIIAHVTVDQFGKMQIFNTDILAALTTMSGIGIDVFGINCSIGPDLMEPAIKILSEHSPVPISIMPNAGLPESENGKTVFRLTPQDLAAHVVRYVDDYGVNLVGGCCGTTPDHIREIARVLKGKTPVTRERSQKVFVSGPQKAICLDSTDGLIRIGERLNIRGSKKVREAVECDGDINFSVLEDVVNEQITDLGLNVIDVCMDSNIKETESVLMSVIQEISKDFSGVFSIDSFSVEALEQAIKVYSGRPIINSISLEEVSEGLDKVDAVVGKTHQHNPVYIALCTNAEGPAKTAEEKANLAKEIFLKCRDKYQIQANQLMIDVNAFPIGSESEEGLNFALESLKAIELIKEIHPDLMVTIGVGNLTNGLAKKTYMRMVLTSVFIHEARTRGLDAAIINPQHYVPLESIDDVDVQLAHRIIFDHNMEAFTELEEIALQKKGQAKEKRTSYDDLPVAQAVCLKIKEGFKDRQQGQIEEGDFSYTYDDTIVLGVAESIKEYEPLEFINDHLMKAMQDLGEGFAKGEVSLPHLLKSADVMKQAMGFLEAWMKHHTGEGLETHQKGSVVLGTVYQDVHSIGKDLAKTLLENYGYNVVDLGVQVSLESFVKQAQEHKAIAIGMSALLVQTSHHMIEVAKMVVERGLKDVALLIGGAPVNNRHATTVAMHGQEEVSKILPNVFYCASAMDGVNVLNQLTSSQENRSMFLEKNVQKLGGYCPQTEKKAPLPRRYVSGHVRGLDASVFFGPKQKEYRLKDFASNINVKTLLSLNWQYGGEKSWQKKGFSESELKEQFKYWVNICDEKEWIQPKTVYGVFPCQSRGDTVVVYDPKDFSQEIGCFDFSVVSDDDQKEEFSVAQYFLSAETGEFDAIGLQLTTGGVGVDAQIGVFQDRGDSEAAWFLQGLSNRVAEDLASTIHATLREHMGLTEKAGARYSPGYPALKDTRANILIAQLLQTELNIGVQVTDAGVFSPTGTTAAVVCFNPQAECG